MKTALKLFWGVAALSLSVGIHAEVFHAENVSIDGSLCAGLSCIQGETFGEDLLKLKETKIRVKFEDTTTSVGFPTNDWEILINDLVNGGDEYFAIKDTTHSRTPFRIDAGAANNSLYIDDDGNIGLGTSVPVTPVHIVDDIGPTLRLETSGVISPPYVWDIRASATTFRISDVVTGFSPIQIKGGAPNVSLVISGDGNVGLGTYLPQRTLHVVDDDFPTIRLEQSGGDPDEHSWDLRANASRFAIENVTGGGTPFQIQDGAGTNSMVISSLGNVGMGIGGSVPSASLHVFRMDGTAKILVEEYSGIAAPRTLFRLENKGNTKFGVMNTEAGVEWAFANPGTGFRLSRQGSGVVEMEIFNNGNMKIAGALTQNSDVNAKTAIADIDPEEILGLVSELPVSQWEYKDARGETHIGPMAQDFYAAFGLGASETGISTIDTAGVALVAIKALAEENQLLRQRLSQLEQQQESDIGKLQQMVMQLMQAQENTRALTAVN